MYGKIKSTHEKIRDSVNEIDKLITEVRDSGDYKLSQTLTSYQDELIRIRDYLFDLRVKNGPKKCPLCGNRNVDVRFIPDDLENWNHNKPYLVRCMMCGTRGPIASTAEEAIKKWNVRCE